MAGQLIERGERRWLVRVFLGRDASGKRRYHNKTIRGTKKDAQRYLNKVLTEVDTGTFIEPSNATVAEYLRKWLVASARPRVRERTAEDYEHHIERHLIPAFGLRKLSQLKPAEIQKLYGYMLDRGLAPRTIRYVHSTLRSALAQAVKWGELARNPADLVDLPRQERRERRVLTRAETARLLTAAKGTRWYALWVLLATTGVRPGEALALKWSDWEDHQLRVQRSLNRSRSGWRLEETKTDRSRRTVYLSRTTGEVLATHRAKQAEEMLASGEEYDRELNLVFANSRGQPLDYRTTVRRHFKPLLAAAGLPMIRPYDLRHTHATHLLMANVHPKVVSERLGHASTVMTMDVYSHVLPDMQEQAAAKLEALLFRAAQTAADSPA
jgi:integrase